MKKSLMCLTAALTLSVAVPSFAAEPPPESGALFCAVPTVSEDMAKLRITSIPVGGIKPPTVGCTDDEARFKAGYHFKLFVSPDRKARIEYAWNKPSEIQAACRNACIEQSKNCKEEFAKGDKAKVAQCTAQLKACSDAQKPSTVQFQKGKCGRRGPGPAQ